MPSSRSVLIAVDELTASLEDPRLPILEAATALVFDEDTGAMWPRPLRPLLDEAHVAGSLFVDVPGELAHLEAQFDHTLPAAEHFAAAASPLGIYNYSGVVVYDAPSWELSRQ
jgi:thiosulfate/3-mercaptopyruvate sulfurtransferase